MRNFIFFIVFITLNSNATDDGLVNDPLNKVYPSKVKILKLKSTPVELYQKTLKVFNHFKVIDPSTSEDLMIFDHIQSKSELEQILSILDIKKQLNRFVTIDDNSVELFNDRDSKTTSEVKLSFEDINRYQSEAILNLQKAHNNPDNLPLLGLKIAIDPGHMSTPEWDKLTGKFIVDKRGKKISEGLIALQTSLLLKAELETLGAKVFVTRVGHNPVSDESLEDISIDDYARYNLLRKSHNDWFINLLNTTNDDQILLKNFANDQNVINLFSEQSRKHYFIFNSDLDARVEKIENFKPDISFVIHFDAHVPEGGNNVGLKKYSKVKTYVHGDLEQSEFASREDRKFVMLHLLDSSSWNASFDLSKSIVNSLSNTLKLDFDIVGGGTSTAVSKGVFARNLAITRKLSGHAHTYIECLHYNDPTEFYSLLKKDYKLLIDGKTTYYSRRLKEVVTAIRNGVVHFVKN